MDKKTAKQLLLIRKAELENLRAQAKDNRKPIALDQTSVGRLSRMDSLQIQAMDKAADAARAKQILRINAALIRIDMDDFGYCVTCDEEIARKRLELDPSTPLCINCARG
ncbi:MAG: TraR/DksA C4-type zinc finger protein [Robiginitomaculum sp.]|nr:TraR/DksA C4-type zinc finger protein [Robiginitomaculum sp.]